MNTVENEYRMSTEPGMTEETDTAEDRIPQEKGLLRRIQAPEHSTERIRSLVYMV
jgi:hypothetical protein